MKELFESTEFILLLIIGAYIVGQIIYEKTRLAILNPLVISVAIIILFLKVADVEYAKFERASEFVRFMLGPVVVALGYMLYKQVKYLKENALSILISITIGSIVGIVSAVILSRLMGADDVLMYSLEPKSVTMPIAFSIAEQSGGSVPLVAIIVFFTGVFGSIAGPIILKLMGIKSKIAKGLALGASAHGVGTAKAIEMGVVEGTIGGIAMGLMGVATAVFIPIINKIL